MKEWTKRVRYISRMRILQKEGKRYLLCAHARYENSSKLVRRYIWRKRWKRKEKNARYVFRVRMRDMSVRKISRRRNIWEEYCVKGRRRVPNRNSSQFIIRWNLIAQASPASRRKRSRWKQGGSGEYVEIRVERSSLLKDRAGGDLCRVGTVYL